MASIALEMDHFRPHHPQPAFEGYYSKFDLPSGASIALIICSVPRADRHPHMVSFNYIPHDFPKTAHFQRELWVDDIQMVNIATAPATTTTHPTKGKTPTDKEKSFELRIPNIGTMTVFTDDTTLYDIVDPSGSFSFSATIPGSTRVPWNRNAAHSTPEGLLIHLPLPLHWHVHCLASTCTFTLAIPSTTTTTQSTTTTTHYPNLSPLDTRPSSTAHVHTEKNWANSFPTSHIWIQARNPSTNSGICIAGGSILAMEAYLLSYHGRDPSHDITFTPPWSMAPAFLPFISPSMRVTRDWDARTVRLSVTGFTRKVEVEAKGERGAFFGLSAPFGDGHRENFLGQSFGATVRVRVWRWEWGWGTGTGLGEWVLMAEEVFEGASLEFGGGAYGMAGKEERVN